MEERRFRILQAPLQVTDFVLVGHLRGMGLFLIIIILGVSGIAFRCNISGLMLRKHDDSAERDGEEYEEMRIHFDQFPCFFFSFAFHCLNYKYYHVRRYVAIIKYIYTC